MAAPEAPALTNRAGPLGSSRSVGRQNVAGGGLGQAVALQESVPMWPSQGPGGNRVSQPLEPGLGLAAACSAHRGCVWFWLRSQPACPASTAEQRRPQGPRVAVWVRGDEPLPDGGPRDGQAGLWGGTPSGTPPPHPSANTPHAR